MTELLTDVTESGTWLRVEEDGVGVLGAHQQPKAAAGRPFTVTWLGAPRRQEIVNFCAAASAALMPEPTLSKVAARGKAVVDGQINTFGGKDWLNAVLQPDADFVRVEFSVLQQSDGLGEGFTLWARLSDQPDKRIGRDFDDDDDAGLYVPLANLLSLQTEITKLIANSQVSAPSTQVVAKSLRLLANYFGEAGTPGAATGRTNTRALRRRSA